LEKIIILKHVTPREVNDDKVKIKIKRGQEN